MAIDRSKFIRTSASQLQQSDKDLNKTLGRKERNTNGHDMDDGQNLFRLYPPHPDSGTSFVVPFTQTFIPAMVQEKDKQGNFLWLDAEKKNPKMKLSVRSVWNTKVHGNKKKDLIEEYISLAKLNANALQFTGDAYKEYMKPIYGKYSDDKSKNINGINYPLQWVVYADKYPNANPAATPVFDELRIKKGIKERINRISAMETADDPLGTDPFTDLSDGRAIKILKDPVAGKDNPQLYYTTELDNSSIKETIGNRVVNVQKTYPLTDEQLEHFMKQEPLSKKYGVKLATRKNFEAQLAGLELLDTKYQMGIFDLPEWSETVLEIDGYYPEVDTPEQADALGAVDSDVVPMEDEVAEESADQFELMNRQELSVYARDNKTGILVRPQINDEQLRDKLREWEANSHIEHKPLPGEEGHVEEAEVEKQIEVSAEQKAQDKKDFLKDLHGVGNGKVPEKKEEVAAPVVVDAKKKLDEMRARMKTNSTLKAV